MSETKPRVRVTGEERRRLAAKAKKIYERKNGTIRLVAIELNRSYGFCRTLLIEAGADLKKSWTVKKDADQ